jgi:hypothetical protein
MLRSGILLGGLETRKNDKKNLPSFLRRTYDAFRKLIFTPSVDILIPAFLQFQIPEEFFA